MSKQLTTAVEPKAVPTEVQKATEQQAEMFYSIFESEARRYLGKVLTTIDASIVETQQNKAVKDLIKSDCKDFMWQMQQHFADRGPGIPTWSGSINLDDVK